MYLLSWSVTIADVGMDTIEIGVEPYDMGPMDILEISADNMIDLECVFQQTNHNLLFSWTREQPNLTETIFEGLHSLDGLNQPTFLGQT